MSSVTQDRANCHTGTIDRSLLGSRMYRRSETVVHTFTRKVRKRFLFGSNAYGTFAVQQSGLKAARGYASYHELKGCSRAVTVPSQNEWHDVSYGRTRNSSVVRLLEVRSILPEKKMKTTKTRIIDKLFKRRSVTEPVYYVQGSGSSFHCAIERNTESNSGVPRSRSHQSDI